MPGHRLFCNCLTFGQIVPLCSFIFDYQYRLHTFQLTQIYKAIFGLFLTLSACMVWGKFSLPKLQVSKEAKISTQVIGTQLTLLEQEYRIYQWDDGQVPSYWQLAYVHSITVDTKQLHVLLLDQIVPTTTSMYTVSIHVFSTVLFLDIPYLKTLILISCLMDFPIDHSKFRVFLHIHSSPHITLMAGVSCLCKLSHVSNYHAKDSELWHLPLELLTPQLPTSEHSCCAQICIVSWGESTCSFCTCECDCIHFTFPSKRSDNN